MVLISLFCASLALAPHVAHATDAKPIEPELVFRVREGRLLSQIVKRNKWFQDVKQSGLYQGALHRLAPVLFAPADEFGQAAGSWKGLLIEHLFETFAAKRPVTFSYYRRSRLVSPFTMSLSQLSSVEVTAAQALIASLKSGDVQKIDLAEKVSVEVTPLLVKQQKFAAILKDGCFTIGRSPDAVAASSLVCARLPKVAIDAELRVNFDEAFPSLTALRSKFIGLQDEARVDFSWVENEARFVPKSSSIELAAGQHLLLKDKNSDELLRALPASALFFSSGFLPEPAKGFAPAAIEEYLKGEKANLRKAKVLPVALVYVALEKAGKLPARAEPAVLIQHSQAGPALVTQLAQTYNGRGKRETFIRRVCPKLVALARSRETLDRLQASCDRKAPSFDQMPERIVAGMKGKTFSSALYANPGRWLGLYIEKGWGRSNANAAVPSEIKLGRALVEQLPPSLFVGTADDKRLVMKAIQ